ncbi:hypothetical protein TIFTF001_039423 [Ficus carica]|uniref:Uncharacterized protein n=1 Tax=Ficus carica TaxID=3494 RepID=A0AA88JB07_FICCA|nr:hypothetical protein TIFTF001_039411 [Ficus carica]GMN70377.1 hypothetical protein TIFTF001_039423 [Ficus carica]
MPQKEKPGNRANKDRSTRISEGIRNRHDYLDPEELSLRFNAKPRPQLNNKFVDLLLIGKRFEDALLLHAPLGPCYEFGAPPLDAEVAGHLICIKQLSYICIDIT